MPLKFFKELQDALGPALHTIEQRRSSGAKGRINDFWHASGTASAGSCCEFAVLQHQHELESVLLGIPNLAADHAKKARVVTSKHRNELQTQAQSN